MIPPRPGLSPGKKRQASLGALTLASAAAQSAASEASGTLGGRLEALVRRSSGFADTYHFGTANKAIGVFHCSESSDDPWEGPKLQRKLVFI